MERKHKKASINNSLFSFLNTSTGNNIGDTGTTSLSEALKSNTTLIELYLDSEDKRKKTHKRRPSTIHSSFHVTSTGNDIGNTGATTLSEALKTNTTLTTLYLEGEKQNTKNKSINKSLLFITSQQET